MLKIRQFTIDYKDAVIQLWCDCNMVVAWNDPQKDIQRKLNDSYEEHRGRGQLSGGTNVEVIEFYQSLGYTVGQSVSLGKRIIADN